MFFSLPNCSWSLATPGCPKDTSGRTSAGCEEVVGGLQGSCALALHLCSGKKRPARPRNVFSFRVRSPGKIRAPRLEALPRAGRLLLACLRCRARHKHSLVSNSPGLTGKTQIFWRFFPFVLAYSKPERIHLPAFSMWWRVARRQPGQNRVRAALKPPLLCRSLPLPARKM